MPSPAAWSSPSLEVPSPAPLSVDDSPASRSRGSSRSRSRVSPRNSNADTQLPPKTAPATLDTNTNTNAADHNHLSPTSATAKTATATAAAAPPSPSSQPTTPLGSGSWLARMFKKGKKEDTVSPPATAPAAVDDGYRSIFASGQQEYRAEQDVIALNQNILNTSTIHNHEINIDYESMVSGAVVRGHTYGMEELERQHQTQSSMHFEQPIERKLDDDTRLLIYAPATNTPRIYQYPQKVEKFVPVNLSDRGTPSPSLSPWLATDVSQATTFQPPSVTRTRGASRDVKNRKILKAVLPTPPLTSQPATKRALPDVMPLSTVPSTNTSASTSPRKSVGFASTTNTKRTSVVNHRRRASSIDGGMDDHYDEVFDDVFADDLDDYEDVDVSEDHGMEDISDDDDKENQYDENFALAEARAFQVIQQQKIKQERELQQHRQKEYQEATKMWL